MFSGAWTSRPSIENVIVLCCGRGISGPLRTPEAEPTDARTDPLRRSLREHGLHVGNGTVAFRAAALDVLLELLAELLDHRADRHGHRVAEHAQAVADDLLLDG